MLEGSQGMVDIVVVWCIMKPLGGFQSLNESTLPWGMVDSCERATVPACCSTPWSQGKEVYGFRVLGYWYNTLIGRPVWQCGASPRISSLFL